MQLSACLVISAYSTFLSMGLCFIGWLFVRYDMLAAKIPASEIEASAREAMSLYGATALHKVQDREFQAFRDRDFGAQSRWKRIEQVIARAMRK
ncbi:hypothetical protein [Asticcacaulis solisilvae]|uniref:hypothetical protein n=1 Tax=Asticcacaulis solisilvae TaxID=1217274 RepID=UPI003FD7D8B4